MLSAQDFQMNTQHITLKSVELSDSQMKPLVNTLQ